MVGFVKTILTIYLMLVRPMNTLRSNIGSILNNASIAIFASIIAFHVPNFDENRNKITSTQLSTSYFFIFLIPYDQILSLLSYCYKKWGKHLNCCKEDTDYRKLKEFENRLINNSSSNMSRSTL